MPDLIRHPEAPSALYPGFRLGGRNDKSQRNKTKLASPKGEGFQPSPIGTLSASIHTFDDEFTSSGHRAGGA